MSDTELLDLFHARQGVICAVGAGGKKSTLYRLLACHRGRVALTSTVFITRFPERLGLTSVVAAEPDLAEALRPHARTPRLGFAAPSEKPGRHAGIAPELVSRLHHETERDATFVKADGARMRWIKAPRDGEPVLPPDCTTLICVVSAKTLGRPLTKEVAHRLEHLGRVTGLQLGETIEPEHLARLMTSDAGLLKDAETCTVVPVINMVDDARSLQLARHAAELALARTDRFDRVILTSMHDDERPVAAVVER